MTFVEVLKSKAPEVTLHAREDRVERELAEAKKNGLINHFKTFALQLLDNHLYYDL